MADVRSNETKHLIEDLMIMFLRYGADPDEVRADLYILLHDVDIVRRTTDLIPYEGDENSDLLKRFIVAKKVKGCTQRTLEFYYTTISKILFEMGKPVQQITSDDVTYYVALQMKRGVSKVTCNNYIRNLSSFFAWMYREEMIKTNPMFRVDRIRQHGTQKKAFTLEDIERMRAHLTTWKEKAMFEMLLSTGCRVSELVNIRISDIDGDEISVLGKGEKYRTVYLNAKARLAVEYYLKERQDVNPFLFPAMISLEERQNVGRKLSVKQAKSWYTRPEYVQPLTHETTGAVEEFTRNLGKKAGVENSHPHRYRRTCATLALRNGMPVELVSKMLGHANLDTTKIYLDLDDESLKQAHRKYVT
ncbi:MAG: tyrosine-type recombinase/integrase [Clostridia bacterium]|nr:tyrosine-type recombinase/integrase [Clostridia bacterium]